MIVKENAIGKDGLDFFFGITFEDLRVGEKA